MREGEKKKAQSHTPGSEYAAAQSATERERERCAQPPTETKMTAAAEARAGGVSHVHEREEESAVLSAVHARVPQKF